MTRRSRSKKSKTRRLRSRGGGFSTGPAYVSAGNLEIRPTPGPGPDCLAASRPGMIPSRDMGGLPGMRGGRYGMSLEASVLDPSRGIVGAPAQAVRIPCESGAPNALNLRGGAVPPSAAVSPIPPVLEVGKAADMAAYHAPTAGYGNRMEAVGGQTPLMLQVPYAAKSCLSGGSRRNRKTKSKKSKKTKSKKHRK